MSILQGKIANNTKLPDGDDDLNYISELEELEDPEDPEVRPPARLLEWRARPLSSLLQDQDQDQGLRTSRSAQQGGTALQYKNADAGCDSTSNALGALSIAMPNLWPK